MQRTHKRQPPRLERIFQRYDAPVFFVTFNTHSRRDLLARPEVHAAFVDYCTKASDHQVGVGRYVLMPDHVHLFVDFGAGAKVTLGEWVKGLKRQLDRCLLSLGEEPLAVADQKLCSFWQPGFYDHLLRRDESYAQKWNYVRENPVRAGFVAEAKAWKYAGESSKSIAFACNPESFRGCPQRILERSGSTTDALRQRTLQSGAPLEPRGARHVKNRGEIRQEREGECAFA